jgi:hypothetical protein
MPKFSDELIHQLSIETFTKIDEIPNKNIEIGLVSTKFDRDFTLLTTSGLSQYTLPIREEENSEPHIELCFALPSYWDLTFQNENCAWVLEKLKFLVNFVLDKKTHFWD